jgi:hypothetical protein
MRKLLILLALTMMTANSVGCCCRGLRDWLFQGGSCCPLLSGGTTYAPPTYAVAPTCAPTCAPATYAPAATYGAPAYAAAPMAAPQYMMPQQYTMAAPMAATCGDPCSNSCSQCSSGCSTCGASYPTEVGCGTPVVGTSYVGTPYVSEPGCSYSDGATPTPTAVYPSPAAE